MESNDLKSTPPDDANLEAWLRSNASLPALPDDGFSRRVLAVLPAAPRRARAPARLLVILLGAMAGAGFTAFKYFSAGAVDFVLPAAGPAAADAIARLADPKLHMALGVTVVTLGFAFWRDVRRRVGL